MLPRPDQREIVLPTPPTRGLAGSIPPRNPSFAPSPYARFAGRRWSSTSTSPCTARPAPPVVSPCTPNRVTGSPSRARAVPTPCCKRPSTITWRGSHRPARHQRHGGGDASPCPRPYRPAGPHRDDVQDLSLPASVDLRWFVGNPEQAATLVAHFTAQPMVAEGAISGLAGKRAWSCRCAATSDAPWMPSASGSTQSPTGAAARMKTPTIRTGTP